MLDVGGRARSGFDFSTWFPAADVTVLDIMDAPNVDVVADAHAMSTSLPRERFDAVSSMATFEHLMMPWVVVTQMNVVMRDGGIAYISTHQTLGMHDIPWDFWRFSDTAWDALFNRHTGLRSSVEPWTSLSLCCHSSIAWATPTPKNRPALRNRR
jgi:hypothetical protein